MYLNKKYFRGQAQWLTPIVPALWEVEVSGLLETTLGNMAKPRLNNNNKYKKLAPVFPGTWEIEVGGSLEPGRLRLQCAMSCITVLQPGQQGKILSQKIKK